MGRNKNSKNGVITKYPVICKFCNNVFEVLGKNKPGSKRPIKFCSQKCYHLSNKGIRPIQFIKKPGGAPKGRIPWNAILKTKLIRQMFSDNIIGINNILDTTNPNYKILFNLYWTDIRKKALKRDKFRCAHCHKIVNLCVHHKIPFAICKKHELSNLITLCEKCHNAVHSGKIIIT